MLAPFFQIIVRQFVRDLKEGKFVRSSPATLAVRLGHKKNGKFEMKTYFGFALADSMFSGNCTIAHREVSVDEVKSLVQQGVVSCLNPSHKATIDAMNLRYEIEVSIPETPPRVSLVQGDSVVVMGVRGLPRLTDRHEYTAEEIEKATFTFSMYSVING